MKIVIDIHPDKYDFVEENIREIWGPVTGFNGFPTKREEVYFGGLSIKYTRDYPWEKNPVKRQMIINSELIDSCKINKLIMELVRWNH